MESIHQQEERIFKEFQKLLDNGKGVSGDGLHYLGEFYYANGYWGRLPGNEETEWKSYCNKKRGLVILTKDLNDDIAWDIREEHGRKNNSEEPTASIQYTFYRNLRCWIYGLLNIDRDGLMPEYPATDVAQECFETCPWVRINLKKVPGESSIKKQVLADYVQTSRALLLRQLEIYNGASIYLDCTRLHGTELLRALYPDVKAFGEGNDEWIYFSEKQHFIIVNSYHPSYSIPGGEAAYYNRMREAVHAFLREHPNFL